MPQAVYEPRPPLNPLQGLVVDPVRRPQSIVFPVIPAFTRFQVLRVDADRVMAAAAKLDFLTQSCVLALSENSSGIQDLRPGSWASINFKRQFCRHFSFVEGKHMKHSHDSFGQKNAVELLLNPTQEQTTLTEKPVEAEIV